MEVKLGIVVGDTACVEVLCTDSQKGHIGSNLRLDLRIVFVWLVVNPWTYLKMYSSHHMNIMQKLSRRPNIVHFQDIIRWD
jgi:hypothetical protein